MVTVTGWCESWKQSDKKPDFFRSKWKWLNTTYRRCVLWSVDVVVVVVHSLLFDEWRNIGEGSLVLVVYQQIIVPLYQVEHDTALSMQTLLKLDAIKIRMMDASEALQVCDEVMMCIFFKLKITFDTQSWQCTLYRHVKCIMF